MSERELTFAQAVREALAEEMRRDSRVCIFGEDVAEAGTPFKVLSGLVEEFGAERVVDTPISEAGFTGVGVGAAITGLRPVVDIMFGDFLTLTMDQMVNQAAKAHYMSGGHWRVPMVMRTTLGATRRSAAQHSQSLHAWLSHVPGLKVVLPSTPYDAKGLLKTAIRDENPVIFFEDKMMYKLKGPVPADDYTIPLGVADVKRVGHAEADIPVDAGARVPAGVPDARVVHADGQNVFVGAEFQQWRQIAGEAFVPVGPPAHQKTVEPDLRMVVHAVQLEGHPVSPLRRIHLEVPAIPGDPAGGESVAVAILLAKRPLDAPVVGDVDPPPARVVKTGLHRNRRRAHGKAPAEIKVLVGSAGPFRGPARAAERGCGGDCDDPLLPTLELMHERGRIVPARDPC